jgi:hypothetical protein
MAVTTTARIGVTQWGAGTDPFTRAQMNASFAAIESVAATLTGAETLTNKTIASPTLSGTVTASGDITLSAAGGFGSLKDYQTLGLMGAI